MREPHPLGTISHLWRYPVKALRGEALAIAELDENGVAGDRRAALFVTSPNHARSGKTYRGKEHNLLHTVEEASAAMTDKPRYVSEHMFPEFKDLVTRYKPSIIFSDGEWELPSADWHARSFWRGCSTSRRSKTMWSSTTAGARTRATSTAATGPPSTRPA